MLISLPNSRNSTSEIDLGRLLAYEPDRGLELVEEEAAGEGDMVVAVEVEVGERLEPWMISEGQSVRAVDECREVT